MKLINCVSQDPGINSGCADKNSEIRWKYEPPMSVTCEQIHLIKNSFSNTQNDMTMHTKPQRGQIYFP